MWPKDDGLWGDGRRAWKRLLRWHDGELSTRGAAGALDALSDLGTVRRVLDQAELTAVRAARHRDMSWAEIATRLGITRQSAWEKWRELDEQDEADAVLGRVALEVVEDAVGEAAAARRRRATVVVPDVVGMNWDDARKVLHDARLVGIGPDPDGPPPEAIGRPDAVVVDQSPEAGAVVAPGTSVTLWVERGGGSGVREPRLPKPEPRAGRAMQDEPSAASG